MKRSPVTNGYAMAGGNVLMLTTVPITSGKVDALALYDMVKGVQRDARIDGLRLYAKRGGRSGDYLAEEFEDPEP